MGFTDRWKEPDGMRHRAYRGILDDPDAERMEPGICNRATDRPAALRREPHHCTQDTTLELITPPLHNPITCHVSPGHRDRGDLGDPPPSRPWANLHTRRRGGELQVRECRRSAGIAQVCIPAEIGQGILPCIDVDHQPHAVRVGAQWCTQHVPGFSGKRLEVTVCDMARTYDHESRCGSGLISGELSS